MGLAPRLTRSICPRGARRERMRGGASASFRQSATQMPCLKFERQVRSPAEILDDSFMGSLEGQHVGFLWGIAIGRTHPYNGAR